VKSSNSEHVYASQGGLIYAENSNVTLLSIESTENDPANVNQASINLKGYLAGVQILGPYIKVNTGFLYAKSLKISKHSVDISK